VNRSASKQEGSARIIEEGGDVVGLKVGKEAVFGI
jgi:hypothetical protein